MRGAVYAKSEEKAKLKLAEIAEQYVFYRKVKIDRILNTNGQLTIEFDNGDIWQAFRYNGSNSCGRRYNIIYIDNNFSADEKLLICSYATLSPYIGITYFD